MFEPIIKTVFLATHT